jgi:hypothetical protein
MLWSLANQLKVMWWNLNCLSLAEQSGSGMIPGILGVGDISALREGPSGFCLAVAEGLWQRLSST